MKHLARPLALGFALLAAAMLVRELWHRPVFEGAAPITLEQVTELSELVTLSVPVQQLIETELAGHTGATRCVLVARGEALISTDLTEAEFEFDRGRRTLALTLPAPRVLTSSLDQTETRTVIITRSGLWQLVPGEAGEAHLAERAMARAQRRLRAAAAEPGRIARAQARTRTLLSGWFQRQGWEATIEWQEP